MKLKDIRERAQFLDFYREHNLVTIEDKINYLFSEMDILHIIPSLNDISLEGTLNILEIFCLEAWDRKD